MVYRARSHRVAALEARYAQEARRRDRCPECGNVPCRVLELDETTGAITESMPEDGCPACGRPVAYEIRIAGTYPLEPEVGAYGR